MQKMTATIAITATATATAATTAETTTTIVTASSTLPLRHMRSTTAGTALTTLITMLFICLLIFTIVPVVMVQAWRNPRDANHVDYQRYYYGSLKEKMKESTSISKCRVDYLPQGDLFARIIPPSKTVTSIWGKYKKENRDKKIFFRTTPNLCQAKQFQKVKTGKYKRGCLRPETDPVTNTTYLLPPRLSYTLHPDHSRCDNTYAVTACTAAAKAPTSVRDTDRYYHNYPFIMEATNVIVARSGFLVLPCGVFGLLSSCEGVSWGIPVAKQAQDYLGDCQNATSRCPYKQYDKVFVMTQYDDTQIGQFILEALPKLVYHLEYIKANKDVRIHYGFSKLPELPSFVLPNLFLNWLGIGDRLVNGTIYAKEVIMPREGGCQDVAYNAWEALNMRETFIRMAAEDPRSAAISVKKRKVLVLTRSAGRFVQNKYDVDIRSWPSDTLTVLLQKLAETFPDLDVDVFSDSNSTLMLCQPCQVRMFSNAEIVIGHHGAGLTNMLYMPRGGLAVEVIPSFDAKHSPGIGIFPRVANIVGLHHYSYYVRDDTTDTIKIDPVKLVQDVAAFYKSVKMWEH
jgi:hypothetical protein